MKKLLHKILIATASLGAIAGATTAVVSCGTKTTNNTPNDQVSTFKDDVSSLAKDLAGSNATFLQGSTVKTGDDIRGDGEYGIGETVSSMLENYPSISADYSIKDLTSPLSGSAKTAKFTITFVDAQDDTVISTKVISFNILWSGSPTPQNGIPGVSDVTPTTGYEPNIPGNPNANATFEGKTSSWYDAGFAWNELLNRPWYSSSGVADTSTYLDNVLKNQKMINLGFITAADKDQIASKLAAEPNNEYVKQAKAEMDKNPNSIIPTIAGALSPIIMNNAVNWNNTNHVGFLSKIRDNGGDYKISFGGWNNYSIAGAASLKTTTADQNSINNVYNAYKSVVQLTNAKYVDFDIEGAEDGAIDDFGHTPLTPAQQQVARDIRIAALQKLKADFPKLKITFTLPVGIDGISTINKNMLTKAKNLNLLDSLNIMSFDYGLTSKGPTEDKRITTPGEEALYAISSANATHNFLVSLGLTSDAAWSKLGMTIMNGRQDVQKQETWITDAQIVTNFAIQHKINSLSNWSMNRDLSQFIKNDFSKPIGGYPAADGYDGKPAQGYPYPFYTSALTNDQLLNYKNETNPTVNGTKYTGTFKTISVNGTTYDINAAMVDGLDTKDFAYTNVVNNFTSSTKQSINEAVINKTVLGKSSTDITNFTGTLPSSGITGFNTDSTYEGFINTERSNTQYYVTSGQSSQLNALAYVQSINLENTQNLWRA